MKKREISTVTVYGLSSPSFPVPLPIPRERSEMQGSGWLDWLVKNDRFKFECGLRAKFTAYKSAKNYWSAQRRVNGRLRHDYLGASSELNYLKLQAVAQHLDMGDEGYWREKEEKKSENVFSETPQVQLAQSGLDLLKEFLAEQGKNSVPDSPRWNQLKRFESWLIERSN